jgi:putative transposase
MARSIDSARRIEVVQAYRAEKARSPSTTYAAVAEAHGVGEASLNRWLRQYRREGHVSPRKRVRSGREPVLGAAAGEAFEKWLLEHPTARLCEAMAYLKQTFGVSVSEATVRRALRARGLGLRAMKWARTEAAHGEKAAQTLRYAERHRGKPESRPHRAAYPSDLTEAEWLAIEPFWADVGAARPTAHSLRDVLDAIRYLAATGCPWRFLPHDYPPQNTIRRWFDIWTGDGTLERVNDALRRLLRRRAQHEETPALLIVDSQTVPCREGGEARGYDGGKKISGRKRHIAVDSHGFIWRAAVHSAGVQDRDGVDLVLEAEIFKPLQRLEKIVFDAGYQGRAEARIRQTTGISTEIVRRRDSLSGVWCRKDGPAPEMRAGFRVLLKRWIVERTFAWCNRRRRLAVDVERTASASLAWMHVAAQHLLVARMVL